MLVDDSAIFNDVIYEKELYSDFHFDQKYVRVYCINISDKKKL